MGIMVYSLLWVMQDFVHHQYEKGPFWNVAAQQIASCVRGARGGPQSPGSLAFIRVRGSV